MGIVTIMLLFASLPMVANCRALTIEDFRWDDVEIEEVNDQYYVVFYFYHFVVFDSCDIGY
jgi:hypothetical protein